MIRMKFNEGLMTYTELQKELSNFKEEVKYKCDSKNLLKSPHYIGSCYTLWKICNLIGPMFDEFEKEFVTSFPIELIRTWDLYESASIHSLAASVCYKKYNNQWDPIPSSRIEKIVSDVLGEDTSFKTNWAQYDDTVHRLVIVEIPHAKELCKKFNNELVDIVDSMNYDFPDYVSEENIEEIKDRAILDLTFKKDKYK